MKVTWINRRILSFQQLNAKKSEGHNLASLLKEAFAEADPGEIEENIRQIRGSQKRRALLWQYASVAAIVGVCLLAAFLPYSKMKSTTMTASECIHQMLRNEHGKSLKSVTFSTKVTAGGPDLSGNASFALFTAAGALNDDVEATSISYDAGTSVRKSTVFTPKTLVEETYIADSVSILVAKDVADAYMDLTENILEDSQHLLPNVYCLGAVSVLDGNLVLDEQGDTTTLFIFQLKCDFSSNVLSDTILTDSSALCNGVTALEGDSVFMDTALVKLYGKHFTTTTTSTYESVDSCSNTVKDPKLMVSVPDVTVSSISQVPVPDLASVTTSDNCGGAVTVVFVSDAITNQTCANRFTVTRTYTATDLCDNRALCVQTITVNDQTVPTISCPANVVVSCVGQIPPGSPAAVTTSDNCGGGTVVVTFNDIISNQISANRYTLKRTYQATDQSRRYTQNVTMNNHEQMSQDSSEDYTVGDVDDQAEMKAWIEHFGYAEVSDQCYNAVLTELIFTPETLRHDGDSSFTRTYEFRATDMCNNSSYGHADFCMEDNTPPVIICPPSNNRLTCEYDLPAPDISAVEAWDDCESNVKVMLTIASIDTGCPNYTMTTNYWFMATDECGNMSTCDQPFQIVDLLPPIYTGPDTIDVGCVDDLPSSGDITGILAPYMTDNCYDVSSFGQHNSGNSVNYELKAKDLCGNWTDKFIVTFVGTGACQPLCTAPQPIWGDLADIINGTSTTSVIEQFINGYGGVTAGKLGKSITATSADCLNNLLPGSGYLNYVRTTYGIANNIVAKSYENRFTITRNYHAMDACGNVSLCTHVITVLDQSPPSLVCPLNVTLSCAGQAPPANVDNDCCSGLVTVTFCRDLSNHNSQQRFSSLLKEDGTLRNRLAANIMSTQLNIWYNLSHNSRNLGEQQLAWLPSCLVSPVVLDEMGVAHSTVQDLLNLSNDYLSGAGFFPQGFGNLLNDAMQNLNSYWQNCQVKDPCSAQIRDSTPNLFDIGLMADPAYTTYRNNDSRGRRYRSEKR